MQHLQLMRLTLVATCFILELHCEQMINWGEPERAPHWSVVDVYVRASRCARNVNDIPDIRWTKHSSFAHITRGSIMASDVRREANEDRLNIREDKSAIEIRAAKRVWGAHAGQIICSDSFNRVFDCSIIVYWLFGPIYKQSGTHSLVNQTHFF